MTFLWPGFLWLLLGAPLLVGVYIHLLRRKKKLAVPYPDLAAIKKGVDSRSKIRRHIPPALILVAVCLLIVACARPSAVVAFTSRGGTLVLAMDVSASMSSTDVSPDRITAAQIAARTLIHDRAPQIRVGIVKFSSAAFLVQSPTTDNFALNAAISNLRPELTTAVGDAVYASLQMIFPDIDVDAMIPGRQESEFVAVGNSNPAPARPKPAISIVQPGSYRSAAIILMTDGRNTAGPDPVEAARLAANMGVRIFTIGFGTPAGQFHGPIQIDANSVLDETTLRRMADITKAQYFRAESAQQLADIYRQLTTVVERKPEQTEITVLFVAAAAGFCALSSALSLLWYRRIV